MGQLDVVSVLPDKPGWQDERRQDGGGGGGNSGSHGGSEHKKAKRRGGAVLVTPSASGTKLSNRFLKSGVGEGGDALARGGSGRCKCFYRLGKGVTPLLHSWERSQGREDREKSCRVSSSSHPHFGRALLLCGEPCHNREGAAVGLGSPPHT